jgi:hypothetical protein
VEGVGPIVEIVEPAAPTKKGIPFPSVWQLAYIFAMALNAVPSIAGEVMLTEKH